MLYAFAVVVSSAFLLLFSCSAFNSLRPLLLRRSLHLVRLEGSAYSDIDSLALNDSIPMEARRALLNMKNDITAVKEALGAVKEAAAQNITAVKEALGAFQLAAAQDISAVKEALSIEKRHGEDTKRLLDAAMMRDAVMNPRSVIEYVELFVMPKTATYYKTKDRRKKWDNFLQDDTTNGPDIMKCLKEKVPSWNTVIKAADQISSIYSYVSEGAHVTSYEIKENPADFPIQIAEGTLLLQGGQAMLCIGDVLGLKIVIKKKGEF